MSLSLRFLFVWLAAFIICCAIVFGLTARGAMAHDVYKELRSKRGVPCCGGEGPNADCSPITDSSQLEEGRYVTRFYSTIWKDWIIVPNERVVPLELPTDQERGVIAHICAKPRANFQYPVEPTDEDPDPKFTVYCAFVRPRSI